MKKLPQIALLAAALAMAPGQISLGEEFYETRLRAGEHSYQDKRLSDAIDNLRIAAVGLLDKPSLEAEALAYLALAQNAAGKPADVDATIVRFLEVEGRFAPYAHLKLDPAIKAEFQTLLLRRVAAPTLLSYPGLANLVETEEQKIANLPPKDRQKAYEAAAKRESRNPQWPLALARDAAAADDSKAAIVWSSKALELESSNVEARALRAHAETQQREWAAARADLDAIPAAELSTRPAILADRFVCLVELKDWGAAAEAGKLVPASESTRADVARARQTLASQAAAK